MSVIHPYKVVITDAQGVEVFVGVWRWTDTCDFFNEIDRKHASEIQDGAHGQIQAFNKDGGECLGLGLYSDTIEQLKALAVHRDSRVTLKSLK